MRKKGFTLVELMVVVLIVGILAAVAIPMMRGRVDAAKWSEGRAGAGAIASSIRAYAAERGEIALEEGGKLRLEEDLGFGPGDLNGTYFAEGDYEIDSASYDGTNLSFSITVTPSGDDGREAPTTPTKMTLSVTNSGPAVWDRD